MEESTLDRMIELVMTHDENGDPVYKGTKEDPQPDPENADGTVTVYLRRPRGQHVQRISELSAEDTHESKRSAELLQILLHGVEGWKGHELKQGKAAHAELSDLPVWMWMRVAFECQEIAGGEFEKLGESVPQSGTS